DGLVDGGRGHGDRVRRPGRRRAARGHAPRGARRRRRARPRDPLPAPVRGAAQGDRPDGRTARGRPAAPERPVTSRPPPPGAAARGSTTGRPIMALFDLVGRRWILRIIWELHRAAGPLTFRELRAACDGISSSVLTTRLRELDESLIVTHG